MSDHIKIGQGNTSSQKKKGVRDRYNKQHAQLRFKIVDRESNNMLFNMLYNF